MAPHALSEPHQAHGVDRLVALARQRGLSIDDLTAAVDLLAAAEVSALSGDETSLLAAHGAPAADGAHLRNYRQHRVSRHVALLADAVEPTVAAERLGVRPATLRSWKAAGLVYAFRVGRENRFPSWNFAPTDPPRPLPGLGEVLAVLPVDLAPVDVDGFMRTPRQSLKVTGDDHAWAPVEWLLDGRDPAAVVEAARYVDVAG